MYAFLNGRSFVKRQSVRRTLLIVGHWSNSSLLASKIGSFLSHCKTQHRPWLLFCLDPLLCRIPRSVALLLSFSSTSTSDRARRQDSQRKDYLCATKLCTSNEGRILYSVIFPFGTVGRNSSPIDILVTIMGHFAPLTYCYSRCT